MVNAYFVKTLLLSDLETIKTNLHFKLMTRLSARGIHISGIFCQTVVSERILSTMKAKVEKLLMLQRLLRRANDYAMGMYFS